MLSWKHLPMGEQKRKEKRKKQMKKLLFLLVVLALCIPLTVGASAATEQDYPAVTLRAGGKTLSVTARRVEGHTFVPLRAFSDLFTDVTYRYDAKTSYATLTAPGLTILAGNGASMLFANERCLWGVKTNRLLNGTMWVPLNPLVKALGLTAYGTGSSSTRTISGSYRAITPASQYYNQNDLYWLSRIVSAESRGEPIQGQIAVGNVILNRVRSRNFPNTVYGVVFQTGQFSPVSNGTIYNSPAWVSVCVAKMCLEGYAVNNDVLFFCNLAKSPSNWIVRNRTRAFTIGSHTFFY